MDDPKIIAAIISALMAILITIVSQLLTGRREKRIAREEERKKVQLEYLNPLRLYLIENHFRLSEIRRFVEKKGNVNFFCLSRIQEIYLVKMDFGLMEKDAT